VGGLPLSDGVVTLREVRAGDAEVLVAGRDDEFHRWMGDGSPDPKPTAIIEVDGEVVGWVDHDHDDTRTWLAPDECNVGYHLFAPHRQRGYAARAVRLLLELLGRDKTYRVATFLIDAENEPSLRVANAVGAVERQRMTLAEGRPQVLMALPLVSRP
jgi:RimJ/RimL family protein N-acetyltransferase